LENETPVDKADVSAALRSYVALGAGAGAGAESPPPPQAAAKTVAHSSAHVFFMKKSLLL
jgi:hypothetical protein